MNEVKCWKTHTNTYTLTHIYTLTLSDRFRGGAEKADDDDDDDEKNKIFETTNAVLNNTQYNLTLIFYYENR